MAVKHAPKRKKSVPKPAATKALKVASPVFANNAPGFFITLEGGEGAGKSSQMTLLKDRLIEYGKEVVTTREPGGSPGAEAVRHVLLSGAAETLGPEMEAILFSAARGDHVDRIIRPALKQGKVAISDRFFDSTRVYQGVSGKVDDKFVRRLERIACGDTWPDLTVIIDLDPKEGMKRASARRNASEAPDRFEKESIKLQTMRRNAYLEIARDEPERCVVINASGTPKQVFARIWKVVEKKMGLTDQKKPPAKRRNSSVNSGQSKKVAHKTLTARKTKATAAGKRDA